MKKVLFTFLLLLSVVGFALAQNKVVKGVVIGKSDNLPIIGAAVVVDGKASMGVATNFEGKFELTVPSSAKNLKVSYLGYKDKIVPISTANMTIYLEPDAKELDAVMVVAYGTQSKNSFTGSASKVDLSNVQSKATSNLSKALEGVAPGVQVFSTGQPGDNAIVQIRGIGSLNSNTAPLYVVDGIPYGMSLNGIDPADIESMTVLKDASATSLYGARAANGVILITTRKGALGKISIEANVRAGYNMRLIPLYDVVRSPEEYVELSYKALKNAYEIPLNDETISWKEELAAKYKAKGKTAPNVADMIFYGNDGVYDGKYSIVPRYEMMWILEGDDANKEGRLINPETGKFRSNLKRRYFDNWEDEIFRIGQNYQADVKVSGGSERTRFYTSMGFQKNIGYYIGSDFSRFNIRNNISTEVIKNMNLTSNISYSRTSQSNPGQSGNFNNGFNYVNNIPPIFPVLLYDETGKPIEDKILKGRYLYDYGGVQGSKRPFGFGINPAGTIALDRLFRNKHLITSNFTLDYRFFNDFKFAINYGLQLEYQDQRSLQNKYYGDAKGKGRLYRLNYLSQYHTFNQILSWNRKFGSHAFDVFVAHESSSSATEYDTADKSILFRDDATYMNNAIKTENIKGYVNESRLESYFGQLRYEYDNRYFLSASLRRDGSSKFAPGHRWGTFGSLGFAWMISNEKFMSSYNWLDNLKFKASYGLLGNQGIVLDYPGFDAPDLYPYTDMYDLLNLNDKPAFARFYVSNPMLTWEKSATFNIGLEGSIYSGAFTWDIEYFVKNTNDMLFKQQIAPSLGYAYFPSNDGAMLNHGLEFNLGARLVNTKLVKFDINVNGGFYRNIITRMAKDSSGKEKDFEVNGVFLRKKGHSVFDFYLKDYKGIDAKGRPLWAAKYRTEEKDGEIVPIYKKIKDGNKEIEVLDYVDDYEVFLNKGEDPKILADTTTNNYNYALKSMVGKSAIPNLVGGFGWTLSVGDVSWSTQFSYGIGGYGYDNTYAALMNSNAIIGTTNFHRDMLNSWTPENTKTNIPMMSAGKDTKYIAYSNNLSTRFLTSRSYLNLANMRISYNVPKDWLKKIGMTSASVFVSGDNLFLLTARKGYVSMSSGNGNSSSYSYLPMSTVSIGAQVKF